MANRVGIDVDIPGYDDALDVDVFRESIWAHAGDYLALNPGRLEEEYNEITAAAAGLIGEYDARANMDSANAILAVSWDGAAADAFASQMSYITTFMDEQQLYIATSAQAVGMMYAVSVNFRESMHSLLIQTTHACREMINKQVSSNPNWRSLFVDIIEGVIDILSAKTAGELVKLGVDTVLSETKDSFKEEPVKGQDELGVVNGFADTMLELRRFYGANLRRIQGWVDRRRKEFEGLPMKLQEPLQKSVTDVDSPDFRYEHFHSASHDDPGVYEPEVQREREKYVAEKPKPGGLIEQRLSGEEGAP